MSRSCTLIDGLITAELRLGRSTDAETKIRLTVQTVQRSQCRRKFLKLFATASEHDFVFKSIPRCKICKLLPLQHITIRFPFTCILKVQTSVQRSLTSAMKLEKLLISDLIEQNCMVYTTDQVDVIRYKCQGRQSFQRPNSKR